MIEYYVITGLYRIRMDYTDYSMYYIEWCINNFDGNRDGVMYE